MVPACEARFEQPAAAGVRERLRQWRAAHPQATLGDIEREADRQLAPVRAALIVETVQAGPSPPRPPCPRCGAAVQRVGTRRRTVVTAQEEPLTVEGPRYRCPACGAELFPPG